MIYQWKERNLHHIGKHNVKRSDAEFVIDHAQSPFPREIEDAKQLVWGKTAAGRFLQVIFVYLDDEEVDFSGLSLMDRLRFEAGADEVGYVIHARDLTSAEKHHYRRITRRRR